MTPLSLRRLCVPRPRSASWRSNQAVSPDMPPAFARTARERVRLENGGYRRGHLRALAQRIEVADKEVRIMGSKPELLRTLVAATSGQSAAFGVHSSALKWRTRQDSNL
jgi:site-specific DNA recombinase